MKYENAKNLSDREFRRNVGIKRETFESVEDYKSSLCKEA
jgi:hypothetical protein